MKYSIKVYLFFLLVVSFSGKTLAMCTTDIDFGNKEDATVGPTISGLRMPSEKDEVASKYYVDSTLSLRRGLVKSWYVDKGVSVDASSLPLLKRDFPPDRSDPSFFRFFRKLDDFYSQKIYLEKPPIADLPEPIYMDGVANQNPSVVLMSSFKQKTSDIGIDSTVGIQMLYELPPLGIRSRPMGKNFYGSCNPRNNPWLCKIGVYWRYRDGKIYTKLWSPWMRFDKSMLEANYLSFAPQQKGPMNIVFQDNIISAPKMISFQNASVAFPDFHFEIKNNTLAATDLFGLYKGGNLRLLANSGVQEFSSNTLKEIQSMLIDGNLANQSIVMKSRGNQGVIESGKLELYSGMQNVTFSASSGIENIAHLNIGTLPANLTKFYDNVYFSPKSLVITSPASSSTSFASSTLKDIRRYEAQTLFVSKIQSKNDMTFDSSLNLNGARLDDIEQFESGPLVIDVKGIHTKSGNLSYGFSKPSFVATLSATNSGVDFKQSRMEHLKIVETPEGLQLNEGKIASSDKARDLVISNDNKKSGVSFLDQDFNAGDFGVRVNDSSNDMAIHYFKNTTKDRDVLFASKSNFSDKPVLIKNDSGDTYFSNHALEIKDFPTVYLASNLDPTGKVSLDKPYLALKNGHELSASTGTDAVLEFKRTTLGATLLDLQKLYYVKGVAPAIADDDLVNSSQTKDLIDVFEKAKLSSDYTGGEHLGLPKGDVSFNKQKIINLKNPSAETDALTVGYWNHAALEPYVAHCASYYDGSPAFDAAAPEDGENSLIEMEDSRVTPASTKKPQVVCESPVADEDDALAHESPFVPGAAAGEDGTYHLNVKVSGVYLMTLNLQMPTDIKGFDSAKISVAEKSDKVFKFKIWGVTTFEANGHLPQNIPLRQVQRSITFITYLKQGELSYQATFGTSSVHQAYGKWFQAFTPTRAPVNAGGDYIIKAGISDSFLSVLPAKLDLWATCIDRCDTD